MGPLGPEYVLAGRCNVDVVTILGVRDKVVFWEYIAYGWLGPVGPVYDLSGCWKVEAVATLGVRAKSVSCEYMPYG